MNTIQMPNIFNRTTSNIVVDTAATAQNLKYLLLSTKNELFGDPFFGTNIKKFFYDQNDVILEDLIIDDIYTAIATFIPQIKLKRSDIKLSKDISTVTVRISCIDQVNFKTDMYNIVLFEANN